MRLRIITTTLLLVALLTSGATAAGVDTKENSSSAITCPSVTEVALDDATLDSYTDCQKQSIFNPVIDRERNKWLRIENQLRNKSASLEENELPLTDSLASLVDNLANLIEDRLDQMPESATNVAD